METDLYQLMTGALGVPEEAFGQPEKATTQTAREADAQRQMPRFTVSEHVRVDERLRADWEAQRRYAGMINYVNSKTKRRRRQAVRPLPTLRTYVEGRVKESMSYVFER